MPEPRLPTYADIEQAASRLDGHAHRTPVLTSRTLDARTGAQLFIKCENLQRAGAFKFRGAFNAISALQPAERERGVIAFSSGNHAQAIALAGSLLQVPVTIVMPRDSASIKLAATRGYGADVRLYDRYTEDRETITHQIARERGLTLIPPYDHPDVIAGQGTVARELLQECGALDVLVVCLGGGGLLSGSALSAEQLAPGCAVYGVEPVAGNDGQQSLRAGHIVRIAPPRSIADGALTTHLGEYTFPIIQRLVADIVTVPDTALVTTMLLLAERLKIVVEPTGCLGLAAVLTELVPVRGKRVGVILSGGNIDLAQFARLTTAAS